MTVALEICAAKRQPIHDKDQVREGMLLVEAIVRQLRAWRRCVLSHDDMVSLGNEGLVDAMMRFDPSRGVEFKAYASQRIRGAILDGMRREGRMPRRAWGRACESLEFDEALHSLDAGESPEETATRSQEAEAVLEAVEELAPEHAELVRRFYWQGASLQEISEELGYARGWGSKAMAAVHSAIRRHLTPQQVKPRRSHGCQSATESRMVASTGPDTGAPVSPPGTETGRQAAPDMALAEHAQGSLCRTAAIRGFRLFQPSMAGRAQAFGLTQASMAGRAQAFGLTQASMAGRAQAFGLTQASMAGRAQAFRLTQASIAGPAQAFGLTQASMAGRAQAFGLTQASMAGRAQAFGLTQASIAGRAQAFGLTQASMAGRAQAFGLTQASMAGRAQAFGLTQASMAGRAQAFGLTQASRPGSASPCRFRAIPRPHRPTGLTASRASLRTRLQSKRSIMNNTELVNAILATRALSTAAFERVLPEARSLKADKVQPLNAEAPAVASRVLGAIPNILAMRDEIARQAPLIPIDRLEQLETYAHALQEAHVRCLSTRKTPTDLRALGEQGDLLRDTLRVDCKALVKRGVIDGDRLAACQGQPGYKIIATELGILVSVMQSCWPQIEGKSAVSAADLERARGIAEALLAFSGAREQSPAQRAAAAVDVRDRIFTLLVENYAIAQRVIQFLRFDEGDAEKFVPSLFGTRHSSSRKDEPERAPVAEATPAPGAVSGDAPFASAANNGPVGSPKSNPFMN